MKFKLEQKQTKQFSFNVTETKEIERDGVPIGIIEGFASTYELDRGDDVILRGAFTKTILRHKQNNRPIRMLRQHSNSMLIGGFPIDSVEERDAGLFVKGEVNLAVQEGAEAYALAKQGVLTDMSIGFSFTSVDDIEREERDGKMVRLIKNLELWEISLVNEPMNASANITAVKTVTPFQDLPLASRDRAWDPDQAIARVRAFTGSEEMPSSSYKDAFMWYDAENGDEFGAYKLHFVDVEQGRLVAVPRGIFAAMAFMRGARGGVDIPERDRAGVMSHINRYYSKMDMPSPFDANKGLGSTFLEICQTLPDVTECLKSWGMSHKETNVLISTIKRLVPRDDGVDVDDVRDDHDLKINDALKKLDEINSSFESKKLNSKLNNILEVTNRGN